MDEGRCEWAFCHETAVATVEWPADPAIGTGRYCARHREALGNDVRDVAGAEVDDA